MEALLSLIIATSLLLGSPGPATLSLAATGAAFGIKGGIKFLTGILCGLIFVIPGSGLGLAVLFASFPDIKISVQVLGGLYIVYVAYKIATAPLLTSNHPTASNSPTLLDGFILNLLNPKAYAAFLALFSQFQLPLTNQTMSFAMTGLVCFMVATVVDSIWLALGSSLRPLFENPRSAKYLRFSFAASMVAAVAMTFFNPGFS